jgi:ATP synthase protein I
MPFNRPIQTPPQRSKMSSGVNAIIEAEKLLQLALMLPCAAVVGWLIGAWADSHFHQTWIAIAGIVFGAISGLFYLIRTALKTEKDTRNGTAVDKGTEKGNPDLKP